MATTAQELVRAAKAEITEIDGAQAKAPAARTLQRLGFDNVKSLAGGQAAWSGRKSGS